MLEVKAKLQALLNQVQEGCVCLCVCWKEGAA